MGDASDNKAQMDPTKVVRAFFNALNTSGPEADAKYLVDSYKTEIPPTPPLSKEQWTGSQKMHLAGFPDFHEAFEVQSVDGNVVRGMNRLSGTHTGDLDPSGMGIGIVPATGKTAKAVVSVTHVVEDDKTVPSKGEPVDNMGFENTLAQLELNHRSRFIKSTMHC